MSLTVTGTVEVIMQNKKDKDQISMLVKEEDGDNWYNQKKEFMDLMPNRGDTVTFYKGKKQDGTPGKYIQGIKILQGGAEVAKGAPAKSGGSWNSNTLGIELGHASNNAVQLAIASKKTSMESVKELTKEFYDMMKSLRAEYEGKETVQETPTEVSPSKAAKPSKATAATVDFDDDIPF